MKNGKKVDFYISDILKEFLLLGKNKDLHQSLSIRSDIALLFVFIEVLSSFWKVYVGGGDDVGKNAQNRE